MLISKSKTSVHEESSATTKTTQLTPPCENLNKIMTNDIMATSSRKRGNKRNYASEPNLPMLTRKRAACFTPRKQISSLATNTIKTRGQVSSTVSLPVTPSPPPPSTSLNLPPSPTLSPSHPLPTTSLEEKTTRTTRSTVTTASNSTQIQEQKRKYVSAPTTGMVTRKRASLAKPAEAPTVVNPSIIPFSTLEPPSSPSPTLNICLESTKSTSPPPPRLFNAPPVEITSRDMSDTSVTKGTLSKLKNETKDSVDQSSSQKAPVDDEEAILQQRSLLDKSLKNVDDEMLLVAKGLHPALLHMMEEIEKKKEDRINLAMARRDAKLKSHQADYDALVHKANTEFVNKHHELRMGIHADIGRRRFKVYNEHATLDDSLRQNDMERPNHIPHMDSSSCWSRPPSPRSLSHKDVCEDIGAIHTKIALDYANVPWVGQHGQ